MAKATAPTNVHTSTRVCFLRKEPGTACSPGPELLSRLVALGCGTSGLLVWTCTGESGHCWAGAPCVADNGVSQEDTGVSGSAGATTRTCAVAGSGFTTLRCWGGGAMTDLVPGGVGCSGALVGTREYGRGALAGAPAIGATGTATCAGVPTTCDAGISGATGISVATGFSVATGISGAGCTRATGGACEAGSGKR